MLKEKLGARRDPLEHAALSAGSTPERHRARRPGTVDFGGGRRACAPDVCPPIKGTGALFVDDKHTSPSTRKSARTSRRRTAARPRAARAAVSTRFPAPTPHGHSFASHGRVERMVARALETTLPSTSTVTQTGRAVSSPRARRRRRRDIVVTSAPRRQSPEPGAAARSAPSPRARRAPARVARTAGAGTTPTRRATAARRATAVARARRARRERPQARPSGVRVHVARARARGRVERRARRAARGARAAAVRSTSRVRAGAATVASEAAASGCCRIARRSRADVGGARAAPRRGHVARAESRRRGRRRVRRTC